MYSKIDKDIATDVVLPPAIQYPYDYDFRQTEPRVVLLTGATGFLGANLLSDLLRSTQHEIVCLVRSGDESAAAEKLRRALELRGFPEKIYGRRLRILLGDLGRPQFGLSQSAFEMLAAEVSLIYHSGAKINLVLPYRVMKPVNVSGTLELLRLASFPPAKSFHHISSIAVFGAPDGRPHSNVSENFRVDFSGRLSEGYAKSKWVAEQLVNQAAERGLSVAIYRPGLITGHSQTGVCNLYDSFSLLIGASIKLQMAPNLEGHIPLTPVDFVSRAIMELSRMPASVGRAFHIVNSTTVSWSEIATLLQEYGYTRNTVPYDQWFQRLSEEAIKNPSGYLELASALLHDSPPFQKQDTRRFAVDNTTSALAGISGMTWPTDYRPWVKSYVSYLASAVV
jgi:thioester reductase-like protein